MSLVRKGPIKPNGPHAAVGPDGSSQGGSFEAIYQQWFREVCTWIRALGGPDADRDDIAQEVFLVVRRRLPAFDGRNLPGWLYRITQRQVRDLRRRAWFRHIFNRRRELETDALAHGSPGPAAAFERKERKRVLYEILGKIREPRRSTFVLFEIEGMSGEEIAQLQDVPLNTVWTRLHHARRDFFSAAAKHHEVLSSAERLVP